MRAIKTRQPLFLSISRGQNSDGKLQKPENSPVFRLADVPFAHARDPARTERHHTWFCLLHEALKKYADFSYFEQTRGGEILKFDHAARLQEMLKRTYNYHGAVLESKWRWAFVHYQAFAQNRTLTGGWLRVYRFLKIGTITGWFSVHRINYLILPVKLISRILYGLLWLRRFDSERGRYRFEKT
jgi:hypothetical protein